MELVEEVLCCLCSHCHLPLSKWMLVQYASSEQIALASLCLVSKLLRALAQPLLFHHFQSHNGDHISKLPLFVRTIIRQPDLAAAVKWISICTPVNPSSFPPAWPSVLNEFSMATIPEAAERLNISQSLLLSLHEYRGGRIPDQFLRRMPFMKFWNFCEQLLLTYTPQLEQLRIEKRRGRRERIRDMSHFTSLGLNLSLPFLRRMTLTFTPTTPHIEPFRDFDIARFAPLLGATERLHTLEIIGARRFLGGRRTIMVPVSPSIRQQEAWCATGLQHLKNLVFTGCCMLPLDELAHLTQLCSSLEAIEFYPVVPRDEPVDIMRAIEPAARTLRRIRINLINASDWRFITHGMQFYNYQPLDYRAFQNFNLLQVLWLDQAAFRKIKFVPNILQPDHSQCNESPADISTPGEEPGDYSANLADILPPFITTLFIVEVFQPSIYADLVYLAEKTKSGSFPQLRKVYVEDGNYPLLSDQEDISNLFTKISVQVTFGKINELDYSMAQ